MAPLPDSLEKVEWGGQLGLDIYELINPVINYKHKKGKNYADQDYFNIRTKVEQKWIFPGITHRFLNWEQEFQSASNSIFNKIEFQQNELDILYKIRKFYWGGDLGQRNRKNIYTTSDLQKEKFTARKVYAGWQNNDRISVELAYETEELDSLYTSEEWRSVREMRTAGMQSMFNFAGQTGKINVSHRQIETDDTAEFDMAEISLSNSFFKDMLQTDSRYSIQNLEFFPKVRELIYVGDELGIYDSLGFIAEDGEYDYVITDIDYDDPQMSVEVNASINLFIDPGRNGNSFLDKLRSETYLFISENSTSSRKKKLYMLDPQVLRNKEHTLYGRSVLDQVIWLDVLPGRILGRLNYGSSETVDQRYNDTMESDKLHSYELMLRLLKYWSSNFEISAERREEEESRFELKVKADIFSLSVQNKLLDNTKLNSELIYNSEQGSEQGSGNQYEISTWELVEIITWNSGRKYRLSARFNYKRNKRSGYGQTSYIDKMDGDIFKWNSSFNYRVNSYTYLKLEYTGNSYPIRDTEHKLRMEIRAEF